MTALSILQIVPGPYGKIEDGKINTAKTRLSNVTDQSFSQLKERLLKRITNSNKK